MKKWKLKWELPTGFELGMVTLAGVLLWFLDASQNLAQGNIGNINVITWWGLPARLSWWIFLTMYTVVMFIIFARAIRSRNTSYQFDTGAIIISMSSMIFIIVAGSFAFYNGADVPIPYVFNLAQISIYHFMGIVGQIFAIVYFTITS